MNGVFNHKIVDAASFIKTGFPISILNKIIVELKYKQINYLIVDKEIVNKTKLKTIIIITNKLIIIII